MCYFFTKYRWFLKISFTWLASNVLPIFVTMFVRSLEIIVLSSSPTIVFTGTDPSFTSLTISSIMSLSMAFVVPFHLILQSCGGGVDLELRDKVHVRQDFDLVEKFSIFPENVLIIDEWPERWEIASTKILIHRKISKQKLLWHSNTRIF